MPRCAPGGSRRSSLLPSLRLPVRKPNIEQICFDARRNVGGRQSARSDMKTNDRFWLRRHKNEWTSVVHRHPDGQFSAGGGFTGGEAFHTTGLRTSNLRRRRRTRMSTRRHRIRANARSASDGPSDGFKLSRWHIRNSSASWPKLETLRPRMSSSGMVLTVPSTRPLRAPAPTGEAGVLVQAAMAPRNTVAGRPATQAVATMRPLRVVEDEKPVQRPVQGPRRPKVVPAELDTPVLMQNRPLQAFDEPVGPRVPRLRPRVPHLVGGTRRDEARLELLAVVRQHPLQTPARRTIARPHDLGQKGGHFRGGHLAHDDPGPPERRGAVTAGQLPDFPATFSFPM